MWQRLKASFSLLGLLKEITILVAVLAIAGGIAHVLAPLPNWPGGQQIEGVVAEQYRQALDRRHWTGLISFAVVYLLVDVLRRCCRAIGSARQGVRD
jgi:hypothetical protein